MSQDEGRKVEVTIPPFAVAEGSKPCDGCGLPRLDRLMFLPEGHPKGVAVLVAKGKCACAPEAQETTAEALAWEREEIARELEQEGHKAAAKLVRARNAEAVLDGKVSSTSKRKS